MLVIWASEACGAASGLAPPEDDVLTVAALFELIHMASLAHDDVIDGAATRRGVPALHVVWGLHSAVLAGDYLFTRANRTALTYSRHGIPSLLSQAVELTCEGEVEQDSRLFDCGVTQREYLSHVCKKTATLFGAACQAGAVLGGASGDVEEAMLRFGIEVGCAYQIVDDVIDLTASPGSSGKPSCSDLRGGILTLPVILAMEGAGRSLIERVFESKRIGDDEIRAIRAACEQGNCVERARENARTLARSAAERLAVLPPSPARSALAAIAIGIVDRQR